MYNDRQIKIVSNVDRKKNYNIYTTPTEMYTHIYTHTFIRTQGLQRPYSYVHTPTRPNTHTRVANATSSNLVDTPTLKCNLTVLSFHC